MKGDGGGLTSFSQLAISINLFSDQRSLIIGIIDRLISIAN